MFAGAKIANYSIGLQMYMAVLKRILGKHSIYNNINESLPKMQWLFQGNNYIILKPNVNTHTLLLKSKESLLKPSHLPL